jgi:hypothetical protein
MEVTSMKFLVLAYGAEADWLALSPDQREVLLAQDAVLRARGDIVAAVGRPTTVRSPGGATARAERAFASAPLPMAGFGLIDADDVDQAVRLVEGTPCARANGAVELWPVRDLEEEAK